MKKLLSLMLVLYSTIAFSEQLQNYQYFAAINLGRAWVSDIKSHTFNQNTDYEMQYLDKSDPVVTDAEIFLGFQTHLTPSILSQLGLAIGKTQDMQVSGNVLEFSDAAFTNFKYDYDIAHTDLGVKGKWIFNSDLFLNPYLSASVGVSFNKTHGFSLRALTDQEFYDPPSSHHSSKAFMYSVGVGLQKMINANWQVGVGYQFEDLGKTRITVDGNQLSNNHLYANSLQLNLTYLF